MAVHQHTHSTVIGGKVFEVDASNRISYINQASTTRDLVGGEIGTLTNMSLVAQNDVFVFDGLDDEIDFSTINIGQTYTIEMNLKLGDLGSRIWFGGDSHSTNYHFNFFSGTFYSRVNGSQVNMVLGLITDTWYNITFVRDGVDSYYYKDGVYIGSQTSASWITDFILYSVGASPTGFYTLGSLGSVKIYNRTLTQAEVTQNYNALKHRFE